MYNYYVDFEFNIFDYYYKLFLVSSEIQCIIAFKNKPLKAALRETFILLITHIEFQKHTIINQIVNPVS